MLAALRLGATAVENCLQAHAELKLREALHHDTSFVRSDGCVSTRAISGDAPGGKLSSGMLRPASISQCHQSLLPTRFEGRYTWVWQKKYTQVGPSGHSISSSRRACARMSAICHVKRYASLHLQQHHKGACRWNYMVRVCGPGGRCLQYHAGARHGMPRRPSDCIAAWLSLIYRVARYARCEI